MAVAAPAYAAASAPPSTTARSRRRAPPARGRRAALAPAVERALDRPRLRPCPPASRTCRAPPRACAPRRSPRRPCRASSASVARARHGGLERRHALERAGLRVAPERRDGGLAGPGPADLPSRLRVPSERRCVVRRHREGTGLGAGDLAALSAVSGLRLQSVPRRARRRPDRPRTRRRAPARRHGDLAALPAPRRAAPASASAARSPCRTPASSATPSSSRRSSSASCRACSSTRRRLRAWSAGCANGLELWSLAVVLNRLGVLDRAALLGSDLLEENLAVARAGIYDVVEITPALRARARWERRDLTRDDAARRAASTSSCAATWRSTSSPRRRRALHRMLAGALAPGGVLHARAAPSASAIPRRSGCAVSSPTSTSGRDDHRRGASPQRSPASSRSPASCSALLQVAVFGLLIGAVRSADDANQRTNQVLGAVQSVSDLEKGVDRRRDGHARVRHHGPRRLPATRSTPRAPRSPTRSGRSASEVADGDERALLSPLFADIDAYLRQWIDPVVAARADLAGAGARLVATGAGKRRVDDMRAQFARDPRRDCGRRRRSSRDDAHASVRRAVIAAVARHRALGAALPALRRLRRGARSSSRCARSRRPRGGWPPATGPRGSRAPTPRAASSARWRARTTSWPTRSSRTTTSSRPSARSCRTTPRSSRPSAASSSGRSPRSTPRRRASR